MMMNTKRTKQELAYELAAALRGNVPANGVPFVAAEIAFVLSKIVNRYIPTAADFIEFIHGIECSIVLRDSLMRDLSPRVDMLLRMQGRYDEDTCRAMILECARHADLDNVNVPASIVPLISKLLSYKPGGVMADIACGHGVVLAQSLADDVELTGEAVDINERSVLFTEMLIAPYKMRSGAYLRSAFDFIGDHMWKYDKVFCYPPFGMRMDRTFRWTEFQRMLPNAFEDVGAGCRSELLFTLATIAAMKEDGRAVVLLPEGALFNQMSGAVAARKYLLNSGYLDCVISLPERLLERTQIGVSLLVFARKDKRESVTMIDATSLGKKGRRFNTILGEDIEKIVNAAYGFRDDESWMAAHCKSVSCSEIREEGYDFSARRYFEKASLPKFSNSARFGDVLIETERGAAIASREMDDLVAHGKGVCYYLSPSHIDNGVISSDLPEMKELPRKIPELNAGDLILMRTGATSKIAVFEDDFDKPVVLSSNLLVCRLKKDLVDPWFLKAFLESETGRTILSSIAIGSVIKSISLKSLGEMRIPLPPMEEQRAVARAFKEKFDRMRKLRQELETVCREMTEVFK